MLIGAALQGQGGAQSGQQITHSAAGAGSCQPLNTRWLNWSPTTAQLTNSESILCRDLDEFSSPCSRLLYKAENAMKWEQYPTSNQRQNDTFFSFFNQWKRFQPNNGIESDVAVETGTFWMLHYPHINDKGTTECNILNGGGRQGEGGRGRGRRAKVSVDAKHAV